MKEDDSSKIVDANVDQVEDMGSREAGGSWSRRWF